MMAVSNEAVFGETQTLAMLLEFLSRLDESSVKTKVIEEIKEEVEKYLKDVDAFASTSNGYLFETIKKSKELRRNILKSDKHDKYEHYTSQFNEKKSTVYSQLLINNIFSLFGCLYYMYYECDTECSDIKGGEWYDEKCDGKGDYQYLNHWLKDEKPSTETSEGGTKRMIQRGFKQDELSTKKGEYLFPKSKSESEAAPLLDYLQGAQLQFCLYYMLFLPKNWNRGQSGHALLFLQALCKMVSENKFTYHYKEADEGGDEKFKKACKDVTEKISEVTKLNIIFPVAADNKTVKYEQLLTPDHFWNYIKWLEKNLEQLIKSLTDMESDASNWDYTELITSETYGPYPWGFTFKDPNWEHKKEQLQQQLKEQVSQLTEALRTLKGALSSISGATSSSKKGTEESSSSTVSTNSAEEPSSSTDSTDSADSTDSNNSTDSTNSAGSTLGGVAGGLGAAAATAGAAYAGSGVIGPVAEAVGKFFKGLIL